MAKLLAKLETGQIPRHELESYQQQPIPAAIAPELMGILFGIDTLEQHRQRFVDKLRALNP